MEVPIHDQATVVDEAVIMDAIENVLINILVPTCDEYLALDL